MTDQYFAYLQNKLKKHNHQVEVSIEDRDNGIAISVKNTTAMMKDEEQKIRENMKMAMDNDNPNLALFYSGDDEDSEGASLGLLLVVNLLRQMNINPELFRIGMVDGDTVARIEIPLNDDYNSIRGL